MGTPDQRLFPSDAGWGRRIEDGAALDVSACSRGSLHDGSEIKHSEGGVFTMQVTEAAAELLKSVRQDSGIDEDAGVRLEPSQDKPGALGLAFRTDPEAGDEVIEESGLRVFIPERVANQLGDRTLDVETTSQGVALSLR